MEPTNPTNSKAPKILAAFIIFVIAVVGVYFWQQREINDLQSRNDGLLSQLEESKKTIAQSSQSHKSNKGVEVTIYSPKNNSIITTPLVVVGQVPGSWSFEAQFPVQLKDSEGNVLGETSAKLQGDWMTDELVPFIATLEFKAPSSQTGTLTLQKDNPSGLTKNDDSLTVPVKF
ncbi:Gmad2 immunoglobulin-like domain-containing protein [Candidatus Saccharibacteria bacterium]|nr:Gmad2 immunoglobulin-like domain-containing protein [Candidatus Saccharibacteria bacterium]